jgi:hypothetical protein
MADRRHDLDRLQYMIRVREVRARLASRDALRRRQSEACAEDALEEVRRRRSEYEEQAVRTFTSRSGEPAAGGESAFRAEEAHRLLSYVAGARLQLLRQVASVRRAELARDRARSTADAARAELRRALFRQQSLASQSERRQQAFQLREREREDESLLEEQVHIRLATDPGRTEG